jgi:hypothetical protein
MDFAIYSRRHLQLTNSAARRMEWLLYTITFFDETGSYLSAKRYTN